MRLVERSETKQALGGDVTLTVVVDETAETTQLFQHIWRLVYQFERRFSRFLPDSELTRFNQAAGLKTPVSKPFHTILNAAAELAKKTDGLFNPFILPALQRAGYLGSAVAAYADDETPDFQERSVVEPAKLELGDDWARIPYGTALDLGGCGKGYLADAIGRAVRKEAVSGYWLNFSGDIACYGTTATGEQIAVAIQPAAETSERYLAVCPLEPSGVATSGTFRRASQSTLKDHHIIDPRSGRTAETNMRLATICAESTVEADVLASCAVILGADKADAFLEASGATDWHLQFVDEQGELQQRPHGERILKQRAEQANA